MGNTRTSPKHRKTVSKKAKREKHAQRTRRSDTRRREEGLKRICIWLPEGEVDHVTSLAHELVAAHRAAATQPLRLVGPAMVPVPKPWKDPMPHDDHRQRHLPF